MSKCMCIVVMKDYMISYLWSTQSWENSASCSKSLSIKYWNISRLFLIIYLFEIDLEIHTHRTHPCTAYHWWIHNLVNVIKILYVFRTSIRRIWQGISLYSFRIQIRSCFQWCSSPLNVYIHVYMTTHATTWFSIDVPYTWLFSPDKLSEKFRLKYVWQLASIPFSVPASDLVIEGTTI